MHRARVLRWLLVAGVVAGSALLLGQLALLRLARVTDFAYHALVKDPERVAPEGRVLVAPADGIVLYVRPVHAGVAPEVVKRGVAVPVADALKWEPEPPFGDGWLIGIYMNTHGVHINRMPDAGLVERRIVWNGPHLEMTAAETTIILTQLVPGLVTLRKLVGLPPYAIEDEADFVLKSARETLAVRDAEGARFFVVRIADYYVGRILTWVAEGARVARGEKIGMITWGSQTDLLLEERPGLRVEVEPGDRVYAGESVVARY
jgi:phosphatidylserine decarboxylase